MASKSVEFTITEQGRKIPSIGIEATELRGIATRENVALVRQALRSAINDIADAVYRTAKETAPRGPTRHPRALAKHPQLKLHEFGITKSRTAVSSTEDLPSFGGGFTVRGASGRFVAGGATGLGNVVARQEVRLNTKKVKHGLFVHEGTRAIITPKHGKYLIFFVRGRWHRRESVPGQSPNPFLTRSATTVDTTYVPARLAQLRAELRALA